MRQPSHHTESTFAADRDSTDNRLLLTSFRHGADFFTDIVPGLIAPCCKREARPVPRLGRYAIVAAASASAGVYVGSEKDQIKAAYAPCPHSACDC